MRWTLRISFLLFLAWLAFLASPFVALYDLSKALQARDLAKIDERVNFRALRISLSRQILGAYLKTPEGQQDMGGLDRQFATEAGTAVLNPFIEKLVTPQALSDLLRKGQPPMDSGIGDGISSPLSMDLSSLGQVWRVFIGSESQGFRAITIPLPATEPKDRQYRITMRLTGTTWRLTGIDLPQALRERLIQQAGAALK